MKKNNVVIWALLLVVVIAGGFFLSQKLDSEQNTDSSNNGNENSEESDMDPESQIDSSLDNIQNYIEVDKTLLPEFILKDEHDNEVSINDYYGKFIVLNFWASWCPPCKAEMPDLQKLHNEFEENDDYVLLSVNLTDGQRETKAKADKFISENDYNFNLLYDYDGIAFNLFNVQSVPSTFFIDEKGYSRGLIIGLTTQEDIKTVLESMK